MKIEELNVRHQNLKVRKAIKYHALIFCLLSLEYSQVLGCSYLEAERYLKPHFIRKNCFKINYCSLLSRKTLETISKKCGYTVYLVMEKTAIKGAVIKEFQFNKIN